MSLTPLHYILYVRIEEMVEQISLRVECVSVYESAVLAPVYVCAYLLYGKILFMWSTTRLKDSVEVTINCIISL